jgi:hypothetical protein
MKITKKTKGVLLREHSNCVWNFVEQAEGIFKEREDNKRC